ncbi:STAM-binding protein-like [Asterias rubens]|uniref:STAM-binding protein-like n=1 Tax=Asterias rubens TaxID=7604 RepID=UPI0014552824|nr:STAM-binding protein-like [Asterias rubens]
MEVTPYEEPSVRVRSLASLGSAVEVDPNVPVMRYFRSGKEIMRMADVYYDERNYENAFILYSKYITIFVEKLPKHPQYKQATPEDLKDTKKKVKQAFPKAEDTKTKLKQIFEKDFKLWQEKEKQRLAKEECIRQKQERMNEEQRRKHEEDEVERRQLQEAKELSLMEEQQRIVEEQRQAFLEEQRRAQQREEAEQMALETSTAAAAAAAAVAAGAEDAGLPPPPSYDAVKAGGYSVYKPAEVDTTIPKSSLRPSPPTIDRSLKVDRSTKPMNLMSTVTASGSNRYGLRDLFIPRDTVEKFLVIARENTTLNLETCGILAGKLAQDAFTITHIVVPKQTSTSDSCTALNEGEIFDVMDSRDLLTLGWIHTHPTQTAFMSSIDLHTHCPYQIMMAEAIAIVCAPTHNQTGYFSLTQDHGLQFISNCKEVGFHPHPSQPPIYEEGQHAKISINSSIQIIDMR